MAGFIRKYLVRLDIDEFHDFDYEDCEKVRKHIKKLKNRYVYKFVTKKIVDRMHLDGRKVKEYLRVYRLSCATDDFA